VARLHKSANEDENWRSSLEADLRQRVEDLGKRLESDLPPASPDLTPALDDVRAELSSLAARLEGFDATTAGALEALQADLEDVARRSAEQTEQIARDSASAEDAVLGRRIDDLEQKLEAESARAEEQVRATEEALRAGLAALGERLAETESTYVEAGGALRRSIERLGAAIVDADGLVADRASDEQPAEHEGPFLAFVPNGKGYRLQEIDGRAPVVGGPVSLGDGEGEFVVTRIGRSPLPLDRRRCVYLELRAGAQVSPDRVP
jgi:hypothetical protein